MRTLVRISLSGLTAGLLATLAVACQDGGGAGDDTSRAISGNELANMVLDLEDFGSEFANFEADEENGFVTAARAAEDSIDPEGEALDLERYGWESGYQVLYFNPEPGTEGSSVWFVASGVDLFDTSENAAGYFQDSRDETKDIVGKTRDGIILDKVEVRDANVADEAVYVQFHVSAEDDPRSHYWASAVTFRRGRLSAEVGIYGFEQQTLEDILTDLARALDKRIGSVLADGTS
jgi:hypothetical protein